MPGQTFAEKDERLRKLGAEIIQQYDGSTLHQRKEINEEVARIANVRREFIDSYGQESNRHQEDNQLDTSVRESATVLLNGVVGRLTPMSSMWFGARQEDEHTDDQTKALELAMRRIWRDITKSSSNFYEAWAESVLDGIHFGNMCMRVIEGNRRKFNFTSIPTGHYVFYLDDEGFADTVLRKYKMTAYAMKRFFGEKGLPNKVLKELRSETKSNQEMKFEVIHRIIRRDDFSEALKQPDPKKREFESVYVLREGNGIVLGQEKNDEVIWEDGLYEHPYPIERMFTVAGNTSGEGITTMILPKCREVQNSKRQFNMVKDSIADRSWWNPGSGLEFPPNQGGELIPFDSMMINTKPEPVPSDPNAPAILEMDLSMLHRGIEEAYFVPFFKLLTNTDIAQTAKTAFETQAIKAEQLSLTIVLVKRFVMFLSRIIETLFAMKQRLGDFDDLLARFPNEYEVEITSPLAKALEGSTKEEFFNLVQLIMAVDPVLPGLKHTFDFTGQMVDIHINSSLDTKYVRTKDEAEEENRKEQELQRMAQAAQVANLAGDAVSKFQQAGSQ